MLIDINSSSYHNFNLLALLNRLGVGIIILTCLNIVVPKGEVTSPPTLLFHSKPVLLLASGEWTSFFYVVTISPMSTVNLESKDPGPWPYWRGIWAFLGTWGDAAWESRELFIPLPMTPLISLQEVFLTFPWGAHPFSAFLPAHHFHYYPKLIEMPEWVQTRSW